MFPKGLRPSLCLYSNIPPSITCRYTRIGYLFSTLFEKKIKAAKRPVASATAGSRSKGVQIPFALGSSAVQCGSKVVQYLIAGEKEIKIDSFT